MDSKDFDQYRSLSMDFSQEVEQGLEKVFADLEVVMKKYNKLGLPAFMQKNLTLFVVKQFYEAFEKAMPLESALMDRFDEWYAKNKKSSSNFDQT